MRIDDLDYELPEELIASTPADRRDAARLMVCPRRGEGVGGVEHRHVRDLPVILREGDLLVVNDTRVLPARFEAVRAGTGGRVEGLFIETRDDATWHVMLKSGGRLTEGERLTLGAGPDTLELLQRQPDGSWFVAKHSELDTRALLDRVGTMPLPPYILKQRERAHGAEPVGFDELDRRRYQTIYAREPGAVAAPTAGLHFTDELLAALRDTGVRVASLTLHVGLGTFAPVRADTLDEHEMHTERYTVPAGTLAALRAARDDGRRVIPVGTTSVRALESLPAEFDTSRDITGATNLLIQPGYTFRWLDGLMTNFHLPRSTLLALVGAVTGLDRLKQLYSEAIAQRYRFYSYGDAMLIV